MNFSPLTVSDLNILDSLLHIPQGLDHVAIRYDFGLTDVRTSIQRLRERDCEIWELIDGGYRLERSGLGVWSEYLGHVLRDSPKRRIEVYPKTTSTQELAKARAAEPLLILADEQTSGRGRLSRCWLAPAGTGVLFTLTHPLSASVDRLSFVTAVAVAQAVERIAGTDTVQIRWPNDIMVDGRKLAGILVETRADDAAVIGVGINVALSRGHLTDFPAELRDHVTSFELCGWPADRLHVAAEVITQIDRNLASPHVALLVDEWRARNLLREQTVRLRSNGETITGAVIDLDPDDGLIVRRQTGEIVHLHAATTTVV